jgi:hypothetical protein
MGSGATKDECTVDTVGLREYAPWHSRRLSGKLWLGEGACVEVLVKQSGALSSADHRQMSSMHSLSSVAADGVVLASIMVSQRGIVYQKKARPNDPRAPADLSIWRCSNSAAPYPSDRLKFFGTG